MKQYSVGNIVNGKVTGVQDYGFFVDLDADNKGLVHISEISDGFVKSVDDFVKVGDNIDVEIIDILDDGQYKLSIKKFTNGNDYNSIGETTSGFSTLKKFLPIWVEEKKCKIGDISKN